MQRLFATLPDLQPEAERGWEMTIIGSSFDEDHRMIDAPITACTGCGTCNVCRELPRGLCDNREDHGPHPRDSPGLGVFWCEAGQSKRLPFAMEQGGK